MSTTVHCRGLNLVLGVATQEEALSLCESIMRLDSSGLKVGMSHRNDLLLPFSFLLLVLAFRFVLVGARDLPNDSSK